MWTDMRRSFLQPGCHQPAAGEQEGAATLSPAHAGASEGSLDHPTLKTWWNTAAAPNYTMDETVHTPQRAAAQSSLKLKIKHNLGVLWPSMRTTEAAESLVLSHRCEQSPTTMPDHENSILASHGGFVEIKSLSRIVLWIPLDSINFKLKPYSWQHHTRDSKTSCVLN